MSLESSTVEILINVIQWMHNTTTNEFSLALRDRTIILKQSIPNALEFSSFPLDFDKDLDFIKDYFQLGIDLDHLYKDWSARDNHFNLINTTNKFNGILILRQDPWECLISFICSSNNNISRISSVYSISLALINKLKQSNDK